MKVFFSFLVVLFVVFSYSSITSAEMESQGESFDYPSIEDKPEVANSSTVELVPLEVAPFSRHPRLQKIDGGNGLTKMSDFQSLNFSKSVGYVDQHAFKKDMLAGITTNIAHFNMFYLKSTRAVFLINRENYGFFTGYFFP